MRACSLTAAADPLRKLPVARLEAWAGGRSRRIWGRPCWPTCKAVSLGKGYCLRQSIRT